MYQFEVNNLSENVSLVQKWASRDGTLFSALSACIGYEALCQLQQQIDAQFSHGDTLQKCFTDLAHFFDTQSAYLFKEPSLQEQLLKEAYAQESIDNWISSCKAHIAYTLKTLKDANMLDITKDTGIKIEHWQCSKLPCYRIYRLGIASNHSQFISISFSVGGSPNPSQSWPGYYSSSVSLTDLMRYWDQTKKDSVPPLAFV